MIYRKIKILFLFIGKFSGLFWVSRHITQNGLRILCYHNFSKGDAIHWRPKLFTHPDTLEKRMSYLKSKGFQVIPLDTAVKQLNSGHLPSLPLVITIDDGWQRILKYADPLFKKLHFPYTIYAYTEYSELEMPVFNLVVQYMLWKTKKKLNSALLKELGLDFKEDIEQDQLSTLIIENAQSGTDNLSRIEFLRKLGNILDVDYSSIDASKRLNLLSSDEIKRMNSNGVDFQLHSHRHQWPLGEESALKEIEDNRTFLEHLVDEKLEHFCYPSGFWTYEQFSFLEKTGIESAVTCEAGLNYSDTHPYRFFRFLDGENISQLEFEAEMSGFLELLRKAKSIFISGHKR